MHTQPSSEIYRAYLMRLWRDDETTPWRVTLENPHTGERHHFSSLADLFAFLTTLGAPHAIDPDPLTQ